MKKSLSETLQQTIKGTILENKEYLRFYSVDASSYKIIPKIVVIPKNEEDIINTIKCAKKFKTSVTVRGAGTGLVGGALNRGIILDMKNFDSCIIKKNHAIVGSGVLKGKLDKNLEKFGKFFPPNPSIGSFCS
ncbi:MAG: FAD-binding oxidoreductase, partial [Nitrosopumilus sp.]